MISRKTGLLIANIVSNNFVHEVRESYNSVRNYKYVQRVKADVLRDFLFEYGVRGYSIEKICKSYDSKQDLKENIMNMHTGVFYNRVNYSNYQGRGQEDLKAITTGIFDKKIQSESLETLENYLRVDGYIFENGKLYEINTDVDEKASIIKTKFNRLNLGQQEEFQKFYNDMNEHFENSKWEDSIHNSRKLYEIVLMECAKYYSHNIIKDNAITGNEKPVQVREYLDKKNYFSEDESNIIRYYYKYISNIASHPKIALQEQADFSRVISVNTMLYALNRLEKFI